MKGLVRGPPLVAHLGHLPPPPLKSGPESHFALEFLPQQLCKPDCDIGDISEIDSLERRDATPK